MATLKLNKKNVEKGLLQYNYFPRTHDHKEEMPAFFNSEKFSAAVANKITPFPLGEDRKKAGYDLMPYRRTRHPNVPRIMGIPHPRAYAELVNCITQNWEKEIHKKCTSENSNLTFEVQDDFRIIVHSYNVAAVDGEVENKDPSLDFGMSYKVKTDITNFYHSIYSHSLPWALIGHKNAKKQQKDTKLWFNKLDKATRFCQRNETKGIPIGPATSSILSEIILFEVDAALREKKHTFSRYIDDYTAYTTSKDKADQFLIDIGRELEKFALNLNPKKTHIVEMPVRLKEKWVTDLNLILGLKREDSKTKKLEQIDIYQLRMLIDRAVALSEEYPDGSVLKYAFSSVLETGVKGPEAERYLQDTLLKYAYYYPAIIPLIDRWAGMYNFAFDIKDRLKILLEHSFRQGQSDNVIWCISYFIRNFIFEKDLVERCIEDGAPMVILMGYVYSKKIGNASNVPLKKWAVSKIEDLKNGIIEMHDIDRYWLVFYQLFFDGVLENPPYKEEPDNNIFKILKKEKVSFVDYNHERLKTLPEIMFAPVIGKIKKDQKLKAQ